MLNKLRVIWLLCIRLWCLLRRSLSWLLLVNCCLLLDESWLLLHLLLHLLDGLAHKWKLHWMHHLLHLLQVNWLPYREWTLHWRLGGWRCLYANEHGWLHTLEVWNCERTTRQLIQTLCLWWLLHCKVLRKHKWLLHHHLLVHGLLLLRRCHWIHLVWHLIELLGLHKLSIRYLFWAFNLSFLLLFF